MIQKTDSSLIICMSSLNHESMRAVQLERCVQIQISRLVTMQRPLIVLALSTMKYKK